MILPETRLLFVETPAFELGADIVLHSMTKSLNGHTDVVAGRWSNSTQTRCLSIHARAE